MGSKDPIRGISLEKYAELAAAIDGITETEAQEAKVAEHGVAAEDWRAAVQGWTERMQSPTNMGRLATEYMQLYNAALAHTEGANLYCEFDDYVVMSALMQVKGPEAMMQHYEITMGQWTTLSAHWQAALNKDPINLAQRRNALQKEEAKRLKAGGEPKPVEFTTMPVGAPAGDASSFNPAVAGQMHMAAGMKQNMIFMAVGGVAFLIVLVVTFLL